MSTYKRVNYREIEPVSGGMHFLREPLDSEKVGVTITRCEPNWKSRPHDHAENGHEEIYVLIEGTATVVIDGESVNMEDGDAVWIPPQATRQIRNDDEECAFVLVSAPVSIEPEDGDAEWSTDGFIG
jgi:mannose-6-phosphate isomerase-like protein (cupin superfamily)